VRRPPLAFLLELFRGKNDVCSNEGGFNNGLFSRKAIGLVTIEMVGGA